MGFLKKRIILKNESGDLSKGMAVVTLEQTGAGIYGEVKTYDLNNSQDLLLGISCDGKEIINTQLLLNSKNIFNFKIDSKININGNICAVIVKKCRDTVNALVWGGNNRPSEYKDDFTNCVMRENKKEDLKFSSVEVSPSVASTSQTKDDVPNKEPQSIINKTDEKAHLFETDDEEIENIIDDAMLGDDFYGLIKDQIDELFRRFPQDDRLTHVIPDSKWVRVDYENNGKEYVVGLVYEGNQVKYICYGVPSKLGEALPEDLEDFSQWLPLEDDSQHDGYYIMFQDASTGESVRLA